MDRGLLHVQEDYNRLYKPKLHRIVPWTSYPLISIIQPHSKEKKHLRQFHLQ